MTLKKAKVIQHNAGCRSNSYSCVDCGDYFDLDRVKGHNSCISEAEKHQGSMFRGQRVGQVTIPTPLGPNGKPVKHYLDSTDDEEEEAPKPAPKKAKKEEKKETPAPVAAAPAAPAAFDITASAKSLISKKGTISLKKLRKGVVKASGGDKDAVTKQLLDALLANASEVKISWGAADDE